MIIITSSLYIIAVGGIEAAFGRVLLNLSKKSLCVASTMLETGSNVRFMGYNAKNLLNSIALLLYKWYNNIKYRLINVDTCLVFLKNGGAI